MHYKLFVLLIALLSIQRINCLCRSKFPIYGIQIDVPISVFAGLQVAYQQPYLHVTTSAILQGIKASCSENSVACVGCYLTGQNFVHVAACGICKAIFTETVLNTPNLINGTYWYETATLSFGLSDTFEINQYAADYGQFNDEAKISWHIDRGNGGFRCGANIGLTNDYNWMKVIYIS